MASMRMRRNDRSGGEARTRARSAWERDAPFKLQALKNAGSLANVQASGQFGLDRQNLSNVGQMNVQEASDKTALERLGIKENASMGRSTLQADTLSNEGRLNRLADLEKPNWQKVYTGKDTVSGEPIYAMQNVNTPASRRKSKNVGTISTDQITSLRGDSMPDPYTLNSEGVYTNISSKGHNKLKALSADTENITPFQMSSPVRDKPQGTGFFNLSHFPNTMNELSGIPKRSLSTIR